MDAIQTIEAGQGDFSEIEFWRRGRNAVVTKYIAVTFVSKRDCQPLKSSFLHNVSLSLSAINVNQYSLLLKRGE